jgi:crotonobetainyl-CoA:carnitine CoA-transferase CaiB-like acyl-CoA transferase
MIDSQDGQTTNSVGPLSHIRVLDFTALVQGPIATQMLGDLGADIIKFEKIGGEWMRHWGILNGRTFDETDAFLAFNRNKRSLTIDLKDPAERERVLEMAKDADVVVENFRPGVMDRLGLGYENFRAVNPRIVYAAASGFGTSGPYVSRPGQDLLIQALSGLMFLTGRRDDPPTSCGIGIADQYTGLHLVVGILAALLHRDRTDEGQRVDLNLLTCAITAQQQELTYYFNHGQLPERPTYNSGSVWATAPFGIYPTSDGHIALAMTPCPILGKALDFPWLDQFDTLDQMVESREEIYARLCEIFMTETNEHWIPRLLEHDVWCAPVQHYDQMVHDPQVAHNEVFWDVPVGSGPETFRTPGSPFRFSLTPARLYRGVPRAGQHTDEIVGHMIERVE